MSLRTSSIQFDPSRLPGGVEPDKLQLVLDELLKEQRLRKETKKLEGSLFEFVKAAWPSIDSAPFQSNWAIEALCLHLEAVTKGNIKRLLVNFPPRASKTSVVSICWPAWVWARQQKTHTSGPGVQFLCSSYNYDLSLTNSTKTRRLIKSPWYQERWGKRFSFREDQDAKSQFDNSEGGTRIATSVGGSLLGIGGNVLIADDLHNTETVESEAERETVTNYWQEFSSTRLNDPQQSAIVVVMQRLHQLDVSGIIIDDEHDYKNWTHLMIPMHHDLKRHCETILKYDDEGDPLETWEDPRTEEGELMWPERFDEVSVASIERSLGPYMASGRLEQSPNPKGGGIIQREWWNLWPPEGEKFDATGKPVVKLEYPEMDFMMAYVDTALTTKEENDWSALTIWGVFTDSTALPKAILIDAWHERLEFSQLVSKIMETCKLRKVDALLIEAKANGISVAQEIRRLTAGNKYMVKLDDPKGDKVARAYSIQHLFAPAPDLLDAWKKDQASDTPRGLKKPKGMIYAPDRKWADMVISECENFPKGDHDDLVDCCVGALRYLRASSMLETKEEVNESLNKRFGPVGEPERLYPV